MCTHRYVCAHAGSERMGWQEAAPCTAVVELPAYVALALAAEKRWLLMATHACTRSSVQGRAEHAEAVTGMKSRH